MRIGFDVGVQASQKDYDTKKAVGIPYRLFRSTSMLSRDDSQAKQRSEGVESEEGI